MVGSKQAPTLIVKCNAPGEFNRTKTVLNLQDNTGHSFSAQIKQSLIS